VDRIHVIATGDEETRAAIDDAVRRALICSASVIVWIPRLIGRTTPDDDAAVQRRVDEYRTLISELGGSGRVRVCLCHAVEQLVGQLGSEAR
jgi:hypothetical protein